MDDSDLLLVDDFFLSEEEESEAAAVSPWRVLVVDDDDGVRTITRFVTRDFTFDGRPLELLEANSAAAARQVIASTPDIAVALLDVVMETDDAGLQLASWIRKDFGDSMMRLVLRTGQPGYAPELDVLIAYDINDYKSKAEITDTRLLSTLITALRGYRDLRTIESGRRGLKEIIALTRPLLTARNLPELHQTVHRGLASLLPVQAVTIVAESDDCAPHPTAQEAFAQKTSILHKTPPALYIPASESPASVLVLDSNQPIAGELHDVIETFCDKLAVCLDNYHLNQQISAVHEITILALADLAEYKDTDTGNHILRVRRYVEAVVATLEEHGGELDASTRDFLGAASVLHDVGKVGIADHILRKPGKLDEQEWSVMQSHSMLGAELLARAAAAVARPSYLSVAADVARSHHERWDGTGYPDRLSGTEIPLSARIVAVADVFDALTSVRPYKKAWTLDDALSYIRQEAGRQFDPQVVAAFEAALPQVVAIHESLKEGAAPCP